MRPVVLALLLALAPTAAAQHIAPTDPKSPADERASFTVPPGFEVQLVAAEPDIGKPIQMAFDARGRLWVTTSRLYPFPAEPGPGTDKLFILSDFAPDGKARKVEVFADNLNIPIGILPLPDCKSCLVSSAGFIYKLTDTKGTGKADKTEALYTGFGFKDTHGMVNSFTLMPDGWVYACHGFSNASTIRATKGPPEFPERRAEIKVQSGNTIRFRPDGSDVQVFTRGQVNPFGMAVDPWFNLYTADCHSRPITQLIPGAVYSSFGKPHDGLGFGPDMINHDHGSTALCGLTYYDADQFPAAYRNTMFLGNVVTNRINFDRIEWVGSTPKAVQNPDFLVSKDPWFRPADLKLGPDGALYVTDFYNKIIGHYEVDLKHPQRDKDRGRVWRIVWKGDGAKPPTMPFTGLTTDPIEKVHLAVGSHNLTVRMLATLQLQRRGEEFSKFRQKQIEATGSYAYRFDDDRGIAYEDWVDPVGSAESPAILLARNLWMMRTNPRAGSIPILNVHRLRRAAGFPTWEPTRLQDKPLREEVLRLLADKDARVVRAAVEALIFRPHADNVKPLIELLKTVPAADTHLRHAARIALRNSLRDNPQAWMTDPDVVKSYAEDAPVVLDVALALPKMTEFLESMFERGLMPADRAAAAAEHIGRYATDPQKRSAVFDYLKEAKGEQRRAVLQAFVRGLQAGGQRLDRLYAGQLLELAAPDLGDPVSAVRVATLKLIGDLPAVSLEFDGSVAVERKIATVATVSGMLSDPKQPDAVRAAAFDTLSRLDPKQSLATANGLIDTPLTPPAVLEKAALVLAGSKDRNHKLAAKDALKAVPYRSAVPIAAALAASASGGDVLLDAVRKGIAPARLLQEKQVLDRLREAKVQNLDAQLAELTKGLPPADQKLADLIKQRAKTYPAAKPDRELGAKLFVKHCGACHQVGGMGGKVGPQLDGIGVRGLERLLEDVLDPNRNVDAAFRARVLTLADGRTLTGLMQRVEGEVLVFADAEGKEARIPLKDIEKNRETTLSPMPANFGESIPEADFRHLMGYLLGLRAKPAP